MSQTIETNTSNTLLYFLAIQPIFDKNNENVNTFPISHFIAFKTYWHLLYGCGMNS